MRILRAADRTAVPWKNGGGVTREITGFPAGASAAGFEWRVSLAEVAADGPFSVFPDVDRILTMVEGAGMSLTLNGTEPRLVDARHLPQHFPGDVPTDCRLLSGPVVNLNVMYRRGTDVTAHVEVVRGRPGRTMPTVPTVPTTVPPHGSTVVIVALDAPAALPETGLILGPYDAVVCTDDPGALHTDGRAAVITVRHG